MGKWKLILLSSILSGCVGGGSTTILQGPEVNNCTPGTYCGYNYVPMVYKVPQYKINKHE